MFYTIVYQSKANEELSLTEIDKMLIRAKIYNKKTGITGCIIYANDQFVQIIEGSKTDIIELYKKIKSDNRHKNVMTLVESSSTQTLWKDWSMAFYKFTGDQVKDQHNRILLETYFENANPNIKSTETFTVLKESILAILN